VRAKQHLDAMNVVCQLRSTLYAWNILLGLVEALSCSPIFYLTSSRPKKK